jgi:hypothetical protein
VPACAQLLEAYLLQGITGAALAAKVRSSFQDSLKDTASRMVRALLLSKAAAMSVSAASASREASYADLCAALPKDLVKTCLQRLMDVAFELLHSYHFMQQWHAAAVAKAQAASEAAAAAASSSSDEQQQAPGGGAAPQQQQLTQVQEATRLLLEAVLQELQQGRLALWEVAAGVVLELLRVPGACQGPDFLQVQYCGLVGWHTGLPETAGICRYLMQHVAGNTHAHIWHSVCTGPRASLATSAVALLQLHQTPPPATTLYTPIS